MEYTKKIVYLVTSLFLATAQAIDCDYSTIKKLENGSYEYSKNCHIHIGQKLEELDLRQEQVKHLGLSTDYYKKAYEMQEDRVNSWMKTSLELDKELQAQKKFSDWEKAAYFGLGILVMYGAAQAAR
jgi:hypothetical protein